MYIHMPDATHSSMLNLCLPTTNTPTGQLTQSVALLSNCHFSYYCNLVIPVVGLTENIY